MLIHAAVAVLLGSRIQQPQQVRLLRIMGATAAAAAAAPSCTMLQCCPFKIGDDCYSIPAAAQAVMTYDGGAERVVGNLQQQEQHIVRRTCWDDIHIMMPCHVISCGLMSCGYS